MMPYLAAAAAFVLVMFALAMSAHATDFVRFTRPDGAKMIVNRNQVAYVTELAGALARTSMNGGGTRIEFVDKSFTDVCEQIDMVMQRLEAKP